MTELNTGCGIYGNDWQFRMQDFYGVGDNYVQHRHRIEFEIQTYGNVTMRGSLVKEMMLAREERAHYGTVHMLDCSLPPSMEEIPFRLIFSKTEKVTFSYLCIGVFAHAFLSYFLRMTGKNSFIELQITPHSRGNYPIARTILLQTYLTGKNQATHSHFKV